MNNEVFDINNVKQEFLQGIAEKYAASFTDIQLEMSVYMLNDFCNVISANDLVLVRIAKEQIYDPTPVPQYQAPPTPQMGLPPQYQQSVNPFDNVPPIAQNIPPRQVQKTVQELNNNLNQGYQVPPAPVKQDIDLSTDRPKTFREKISEMRSAPKKHPGDKVNPNED